MVDEGEWEWIEREARGDCNHLLLATTLPVLLAPAMHHLEAWNEAVCAGAWGRTAARLGENVRQALDLEHWAAFRSSFNRFAALVQRVTTGPEAPATVNVISGDVHHSYVARADFAGRAGSPVHQLVCSPVHHRVPWVFKLPMRAGWFRPLARVVRRVVRRRGVPNPPLSWHLVSGPFFGNALATLVLGDRHAEFVIEKARRAGGVSLLRPTSRVELAGGRGSG